MVTDINANTKFIYYYCAVHVDTSKGNFDYVLTADSIEFLEEQFSEFIGSNYDTLNSIELSLRVKK